MLRAVCERSRRGDVRSTHASVTTRGGQVSSNGVTNDMEVTTMKNASRSRTIRCRLGGFASKLAFAMATPTRRLNESRFICKLILSYDGGGRVLGKLAPTSATNLLGSE